MEIVHEFEIYWKFNRYNDFEFLSADPILNDLNELKSSRYHDFQKNQPWRMFLRKRSQ